MPISERPSKHVTQAAAASTPGRSTAGATRSVFANRVSPVHDACALGRGAAGAGVAGCVVEDLSALAVRGGSPEPGHLSGGGSVSPAHGCPRRPRRAPQGPWRGGWARRVMKPARLFRHPALPALPACRKIGQSAPGQTMPGSRAKPSFKGRERRPRGALRGDCFQPGGKKQKHAGLGSRQPRSSSLSKAGPPGARPPPHLATWAQPGLSLCLRPGSPSKHGTPGAPPGRGRRGRGLPPAPARPGAVFQVPIRIRASLLRLAVC